MTNDYTEHAKLSPSGSKKWFACPGSLVLEAPIPNVANQYSDDGTCKHWVAAECLNNKLDATNFVGELIAVNTAKEGPRYVRFTDEMADEVQGEVDKVRARAKDAQLLLVERRVDFSEVVQEPNSFGTLDVGIVHADGELEVDDFKFGHTPVEVEENTQLMIYALALYLELSLGYDISGIRLAIHQPRAAGTTEWTCSVEDLLAFGETVRLKASTVRGAEQRYAEITASPDAATPGEMAEWERIYLNQTPNEVECAFCRAKPTCPSAQRYMQETLGADFVAVSEGELPDPKEFPPAELAVVMAAAGFAEDFFKAARAETERRLLAGIDVPGFGLELGRKGHRRFKDEAEALRVVRDVWRLKKEDAFDWSLKTPTSYEKMTKPITVKDDNGKEMKMPPLIGPKRWKVMQEMITQNEPKPSVKPLSAIKVPYTPPKLEETAFQPVAADDGSDLA